MRIIGTLLAVFLFSANAHAASDIEQLARSWKWQKVLQYNEHGVSEIQQADFFLAVNGATDSVAELNATLAIFRNNPKTICNYPARHLLTTQAGLTEAFDYRVCEEFQQWQRGSAVDKASLIFADGYLKNPASFHGHLFIKLSPKGNPGDLLDNSLNYGAVVPDDEDPVTYILKGLFGGYDARYSAQPFYRHNLSYGQVELRNLWDYRLNISESDAQLLSAHLFELSRTHYTYYFTSKNCAYYVARALELVAGDHLVSTAEMTVFPGEIIQRIAAPNLNLVSAIVLNASEQKTFQSQYHALSSVQQEALRSYLKGQKTTFEALSQAEQKQVLITLSSYYTFLYRRAPDEQHFQKARGEVLRALLQYPAGNNFKIAIEADEPHLGQGATLLRVGHTYHSAEASRQTFMFRPTYYDRLQPKIGKPANSSLTMGELTLSHNAGTVRLESLRAVDITSLNVSNTGLPGDGGRSWALGVGADRDYARHSDSDLAVYISGEYGLAEQLNDNLVGYALLGGKLHANYQSSDAHNVTLWTRVGVEGQISDANWYCELQQPMSVASTSHRQTLKTACGVNLWHTDSVDFRFTAQKQDYTEATLSLSIYF